jgi:hypothetical protein
MDGNYLNAIKEYLPPNRNVASFGGICPHNKFSVSPDAPPALHASAHHGAPALFPTGEPRRAHRDAADGAIYTPTTAPPIRPRRRHPYAHDGAINTRTNSVHESQPGFSGGRVMVFDPPKALPDHRPATNQALTKVRTRGPMAASDDCQ